jgi:hypothetical protein
MSTPLIRKVTLELEALPPDLRDLSLSCHPRSLLFLQLGGAKSAPPGLAPESALRLHPCRALPSAPVSSSLERNPVLEQLVIVVDREK